MSYVSGFRRSVAAPVAALLAPAYLAGCFHYVPVDATLTPASGTDVRATLANPAPFNLGAETVNEVRQVEGTVVETAPDSLGMWVKWLYPSIGEKVDGNHAEFYLHRSNLAHLEEWKVSGKRTAFAVGLTVALIAAGMATVSLARGTTGGTGSPPPPPNAQRR